jgi:restriction endonuclease S subunit
LGSYPVKPLGEICKRVLCGPFGSAIKSTAYVGHGIPFIRITNIKLGEFDEGDLVYISKADSERLHRTQLGAGDLVISQRGTIGNVCQIPEAIQVCNISANTIGVKPGNSINPKYLLYFLVSNEGQKQFHRAVSGHVQAKITTSDVESIEVPLLPRPIQDAIADKMDAAHQRKRELEAEAEVLLESIDGYVLGELRIELGPAPAPRPWFEGWASKVKGGRLDVGSASNTFDPRSFPSAKWAQLCEIAALPRETLDTRGMPDEEFLFVGMTDVDDELGQVTMHRLSGREIGQSKRVFKGGDTVFARIEPCIYNRKIALIPEDVELAVGSTELLVARPRKEIKSQFLTLCLRSELIQRQIVGLMTGTTGRRRLPHSDFASLFVPVCSMEKQSEIVVEVQRRRERAVALRAEAEWVVAEAKEEMEWMILGEEGG